jgi:predicted RecA/RadA family phage recombinase
MAKNYVQPGKTVTVVAPYDVLSGAGVKVGSLFGIAQHDAVSGAEVEIDTQGVWDIAKVSAQAWASVGLPIYWDNTDKVCTTTASTNLCIGLNLATAANPSATGRVRLNMGPQGIQGIQGEPG